MLRQASVHQLRSGSFNRTNGHIVVCMRFYPRNLPKILRDEYQASLAPSPELFAEWKKEEKKAGHDAAFAKVSYENRFSLSETGLAHLRRLAELSTQKDVFLICQCATGERCHREILLLAAAELFGAKTGNIYHSYPIFLERLRNGTAKQT